MARNHWNSHMKAQILVRHVRLRSDKQSLDIHERPVADSPAIPSWRTRRIRRNILTETPIVSRGRWF